MMDTEAQELEAKTTQNQIIPEDGPLKELSGYKGNAFMRFHMWLKNRALGIAMVALSLSSATAIILTYQLLDLGNICFHIESKYAAIIIAAIVGVAGAGITAYFSYISAKKIKFFETYFHKKSEAFSMFIGLIDIANYTSKESLENMKGAVAWGNTCLLYCNDENVRLMKDFINYLCDIYGAELHKEISGFSKIIDPTYYEKYLKKVDEIDFECV